MNDQDRNNLSMRRIRAALTSRGLDRDVSLRKKLTGLSPTQMSRLIANIHELNKRTRDACLNRLSVVLAVDVAWLDGSPDAEAPARMAALADEIPEPFAWAWIGEVEEVWIRYFTVAHPGKLVLAMRKAAEEADANGCALVLRPSDLLVSPSSLSLAPAAWVLNASQFRIVGKYLCCKPCPVDRLGSVVGHRPEISDLTDDMRLWWTEATGMQVPQADAQRSAADVASDCALMGLPSGAPLSKLWSRFKKILAQQPDQKDVLQSRARDAFVLSRSHPVPVHELRDEYAGLYHLFAEPQQRAMPHQSALTNYYTEDVVWKTLGIFLNKNEREELLNYSIQKKWLFKIVTNGGVFYLVPNSDDLRLTAKRAKNVQD